MPANPRSLDLLVSNAVIEVYCGSTDEDFHKITQDALKGAKEDGLWLACNCLAYEGEFPLFAPCHRNSYHLRRLPHPRPEHHPDCPLNRDTSRKREHGLRDRPVYKAPTGDFDVLGRERKNGQSVKHTGGRNGRRSSTLSRPGLCSQLFRLLASAGLNVYQPGRTKEDQESWQRALADATRGVEIAPGRPLPDLWFRFPEEWDAEQVGRKLDRAAEAWPSGRRPQAYVCGWVGKDGISAKGFRRNGKRINVLEGVVRPKVRGNFVSGPFLVLGVVARPRGATGYECLKAFAHPIVAPVLPIPVDSGNERVAFGVLKRHTLGVLRKNWPERRFSLEKPVFSVGENNTLPDFIIRAGPGEKAPRHIVEVMGFDDSDYRERKQRMHKLMEEVGTVHTLEGKLNYSRAKWSIGTAIGRKISEELKKREIDP